MAFLLAIPAALGPLLLGSVDLWAQTGVFFVVVFGLLGLFWSKLNSAAGFSPLEKGKNRTLLLWIGALSVLGGTSAFFGPLPFYALPGWRVWLVGFAVLGLAATSGPEVLSRVDQAVCLSAWLFVLAAFYQKTEFFLGRATVPEPRLLLLNANILAGATLLLLPIAVEGGDWLLGLGLLCVLALTRSLGAWLALILALAVMRRRSGFLGFLSAIAVAVAFAGGLIFKLRSPLALNRWYWWSAAARMVAAKPWLGFGPGTFPYVFEAYWDARHPLLSLYAHNHFLEVAAECGLPYLLIWLCGVVYLLKKSRTAKSVGVAALLFDSLWDYPLSIPGVLWLFCYCLGGGLAAAESNEQDETRLPDLASFEVPPVPRGRSLRRFALGAAAALAAAALAWPAWARWQSSRFEAVAVEQYKEGASPARVIGLLDRASSWCPNPEADRLAAEVELSRDELGSGKQRLEKAAFYLNRSLALSPYRASTRAMAAQTSAALGRAP